MVADGSADRWGDQNDPFGEEFYIVPPDELIRARDAPISLFLAESVKLGKGGKGYLRL